jgi:S-adenosylmethionine:tRNA-ribosyltransferase-isomerase (queuine synthetase)
MASRNRDTSKLLNLVDLAPGVKHRVVLNVRDVLKASGVLV